ncbi:DNA polymerase III subunit gamma/tau [Sulfurovum sp. zt1-1]|uniref:DNA polymerase III subunit gamma/tau n=1 Tax=Sulfurovum zhangzhouensis TaxID=3019067 RepID=A0ABT7QWV2_9BACT|nr:DNA polymerase III subunit gamma/tau [Sulfurovum zhangzhouensis]MDM5271325.1 DNA polymerase III subunit gamma/tau [Sulfurovum zhangzhouensis]
MSLALARKYRPATFSDLIGQEAVSQTLSLALEGDRLSHAYLFSGLRGSGKTSTARIFAKALLCETGTSSHPCGVCTHCVMASENRHMDIIEMDAASNRGIDDIKDLIEHTKYKPSSARFKIFIIDEVHMLTNQAFNALLKTLEEPPAFVKFILATTDPLKLPATILSRTQHFRFKKIPQNLVQGHLEHILNLENIGFEKEALDIIARTGAGSLRDSLTLLDQAIVYSKNYVDVSTVTNMLGIIEPSLLEQLIQNIIRKDQSKVLEFLKIASNYEAEMILDELTLYLKAQLLSKSTALTPMIIERFFRVIAESKGLLALGSDGEFILTLTLFKMMEALHIKEIDTMIHALEKELQGIQITMPSIEPIQPTHSEVITITEADLTPLRPSVKQESPVEPNVVKEILEPSPETTEEINEQNIEQILEESSVIEEPFIDEQETEIKPDEPLQEKVTAPDLNKKRFEALVQKIFDRDFELGMCFETNIEFESFENGTLTWSSTAQGEEKKQLITHWGVINMFVKELFGFDTKILNISKEQSPQAQEETKKKSDEIMISSSENSTAPTDEEKECNASASMLEDVEMKSSCIAPEAGETEAAKEKDPSTLLEEPMIKAAIELFDPKKVRIKRKS